MNISRHCFVLLLFLVFSIGSAFAVSEIPTSDKTVVVDGHVVHNVGNLWNHVSNFGLIGAWPGTTTQFSNAPSARWPGENGHDYLWGAGLWVGGRVLGVPCVSTAGNPDLEFMATEAPGDTIYCTSDGAPGGNRYPWPNADDDNDGLENEDPLNGLDDDNDGLIDEDFAAFGDQQFIARYNDYQPVVIENLPDHTPMNIDIVQKSIQWSSPQGENFIGYDFTVTNVGETDIEDVYLGMHSDFDISNADNNHAGYLTIMAAISDGSWVPVKVAYMYSAHNPYGTYGYAGWVLCGHSTDPTGLLAPVDHVMHSYHGLVGSRPFEDGGDPTNDVERYQLLSEPHIDNNSTGASGWDYRTLMSSGPFPTLGAGKSINYQVALVVGEDLGALLTNAGEAWAICAGKSFDRDGDPRNGDEFVVNWLPLEDIPVATCTGSLTAERVNDGARLVVETNMDMLSSLAIIRQPGPGVSMRRWSASELAEEGFSGHNSILSLVDTDPVAWPREYNLVFENSGHSTTLDNVVMGRTPASEIELLASPNPFNPTVNIQFVVPDAGPVLLQIFDLRGKLVRTLLKGHHSGGVDSAGWNGEDERGNAMASGVYLMRLQVGDTVTGQRITLVR